jgi:hypothetical protein
MKIQSYSGNNQPGSLLKVDNSTKSVSTKKIMSISMVATVVFLIIAIVIKIKQYVQVNHIDRIKNHLYGT